MPPQRSFHRLAMAAATAVSMSLAGGCSRPPSQGAIAQKINMGSSQHVRGLGDLSGFRMIAADTTALVVLDDLPAARLRITELENAWKDAAPRMKPHAAKDWHAIDTALDRSVDALQAEVPDHSACQAALTHLLRTFDAIQRKS